MTLPNHVPKVTTGAQSHDFMAKKISERSGLTFWGAYVPTVPVWLSQFGSLWCHTGFLIYICDFRGQWHIKKQTISIFVKSSRGSRVTFIFLSFVLGCSKRFNRMSFKFSSLLLILGQCKD